MTVKLNLVDAYLLSYSWMFMAVHMQTFDLKHLGIYCEPEGRGDVANIRFVSTFQ